MCTSSEELGFRVKVNVRVGVRYRSGVPVKLLSADALITVAGYAPQKITLTEFGIAKTV